MKHCRWTCKSRGQHKLYYNDNDNNDDKNNICISKTNSSSGSGSSSSSGNSNSSSSSSNSSSIRDILNRTQQQKDCVDSTLHLLFPQPVLSREGGRAKGEGAGEGAGECGIQILDIKHQDSREGHIKVNKVSFITIPRAPFTPTMDLFQRQRWGKVQEDRVQRIGAFPSEVTALNWTDLNSSKPTVLQSEIKKKAIWMGNGQTCNLALTLSLPVWGQHQLSVQFSSFSRPIGSLGLGTGSLTSILRHFKPQKWFTIEWLLLLWFHNDLYVSLHCDSNCYQVQMYSLTFSTFLPLLTVSCLSTMVFLQKELYKIQN